MNPRERATAWERERLSLYAVLSERSQGRTAAEEPDDTRTCFQRDTDRIVHSKAFRRLMHKTQMFLMPEGDHYRTRMTHALEVSRIARSMARALRLNEDLTEAIALAHDLGHAPFGHAGERALNDIVSGGFSHNAQSLRIVRRLEKSGRGLNLSLEVENGILHHSGDEPAETLEGRLVHYADRIAYLSHDMDDAIRGGLLTLESVPFRLRQVLGDTPRERINTLVTDLIAHSQNKGDLCLSAEKQEAMDELRAFMFSEVYTHSVAKAEESKLRALMELLFTYYCQRYELLPDDLRQIGETDGKERAVCDYISGMTDRFFQQKCVEAFIPQGWSKL